MKLLSFTFLFLFTFSSCGTKYAELIGYWSLDDVELENNASEKLKKNLEQTRIEIKNAKGFMNFVNDHQLIMGDESMTKPSEFEYKIENDKIVFDERDGEMSMEIISLDAKLLKIKPSKTEGSEHVTILIFKKNID
jgi:hypothetical protein